MVGMLTANSFDSSMSVCECLRGTMLTATRGGFIEVGIAQARVMMFGFSGLAFACDEYGVHRVEEHAGMLNVYGDFSWHSVSPQRFTWNLSIVSFAFSRFFWCSARNSLTRSARSFLQSPHITSPDLHCLALSVIFLSSSSNR